MNLKNKKYNNEKRLTSFSGKGRLLIFFAFLMMFGTVDSFGQSRQELEKQRVKLQKEIKEINTLLFKSQKKEKTLLSDLSDLVKRIGVRNQLISTINEETEQLTREIKENEKEVKILQNRLESLKKDYAEMVVQSYKSKTKNSRLMFLLSSENFHQAYKRLEYIKQYADYRERQGEEIKVETIKLQNLNDYLVETREEKERLWQLISKKKTIFITKKLHERN